MFYVNRSLSKLRIKRSYLGHWLRYIGLPKEVLMVKDMVVDIVVQVVILLASGFAGVATVVLTNYWNSVIKDKKYLSGLMVQEATRADLEKKIIAGMRYLAEQEAKSLKANPQFKIPSEQKLQTVVDYVLPLVGGADKLKKIGVDIEKEIEQVLNKVRPDNINFPYIR